jgi:hypothetical protein
MKPGGKDEEVLTTSVSEAAAQAGADVNPEGGGPEAIDDDGGRHASAARSAAITPHSRVSGRLSDHGGGGPNQGGVVRSRPPVG